MTIKELEILIKPDSIIDRYISQIVYYYKSRNEEGALDTSIDWSIAADVCNDFIYEDRLYYDDESFAFLHKNRINNFSEAIDEYGCKDINSIATFYYQEYLKECLDEEIEDLKIIDELKHKYIDASSEEEKSKIEQEIVDQFDKRTLDQIRDCVELSKQNQDDKMEM